MIDVIKQESGETLSFEEALQKIRETVTALESGDLTLEESMTTYQQGTSLIEQCRTMIEHAEIRISELSQDDGTDRQDAD